MTWHLVTTDFPPRVGGIASWSVAVARVLVDAGEEVLVHAREPGPSDLPVTRMWGRSWRRWQGVWGALSTLPRLRGDDVVLAATWPLAVHLVGRAPLLVAYHGSDITRPPPIPGRERVAAAAKNLPVSRFLGSLLGAPYTVLPNPIRPVAPARRGDAILVIARLGPLKGVDTAIEFAHRLRRPIVIVGDGPERPALEAQAEKLGVRATFTGALPPDQIPWDDTWALVLFSRTDAEGGAEGLGIVLLEAAARGIPTLGTDVGGIPEAATVVLKDPLADTVPPLPSGQAVQSWLAEHHGPERTLAVLMAAR